MERIEQRSPESYLSVNVYRGSGRWNVAVLLRTPGKPYPRLLRALHEADLGGDDLSLSEATAKAADVLWKLSQDLRGAAPGGAGPEPRSGLRGGTGG